MPEAEVVSATDLDYEAYARFMQESYRELLARAGLSSDFMTPAYYRWKYATPAGPARVSLLQDEQGICSSSALMPYPVQAGSERAPAWQSLDAATHPRARRQGGFVRCLQAAMESAGPAEALFAFPNASSLPSFLKLGWRESGVVTTWINPFALLGRRRTGPFATPPDRVPESSGIRLAKNEAYLDWRYRRHPVFRYEMFGDRDHLAVVRTARVMGLPVTLVMEWLGPEPHRLALEVAAWSRRQGCPLLVMVNSATSLRSGLRAGFLPVPSRLLPKRQVQVVAGRPLGRRLWALQTGDWDAF